MVVKGTFPCKILLADITLIRLLSGVDPHMHDKDTFIYKLLIADITLLRHFPNMNTPMLDKDIFLYQLLIEDITVIRLLHLPSGKYQMIDINIRMISVFLPVFDHL